MISQTYVLENLEPYNYSLCNINARKHGLHLMLWKQPDDLMTHYLEKRGKVGIA